MTAKKRNWTIRKRMILLLIPAIIAVLIIATLFSLQLSSAAQKEVAYDDTLNSARSYAHEFNTGMSDYLTKSRTFSLVLNQNTRMTREDVLDIQHSLLEDNPRAIGIGVIFEPGTFDRQDGRYANTPGFDATGRFATYWNRLNGTESLIPVVDIETSDWYTIPKTTQKEMVMEPLLYENVLMTSYISPIIRNHTFIGTVGIDVPLDSLDRTVSQVKVFDTGYAFLVSNSGIFVSSPNKDYIGRMSLDELSREKNNHNLAAMAADIRKGKEGYAEMADPFTGKNVVMFYSPIHTGNWSMVVVTPTDEMLAGVTQLGRVMLLIGIFSIVLLGGIVIVVARNLSEPIVTMSRTADRIASGNLDVNVPDQEGELGILANAFNNMAIRLRELIGRFEEKVAELENTQVALKESEEKYRHLIENSHDIIYTLNPEGILTFVSPSWTTILGHKVHEVVGKPFRQFVHPEDLARCFGYLQTMIDTGQRQIGIEYRVQHADGSWRWHSTNAVPLWDGSGMIVGAEGSASDITERKRSDEALHLFKELVEYSSDAIGMSTPGGRHYYQNETFNRLFGNVGYNPVDTVYVDKAIGKHVFDTILGGGSWQGEVKMFGKDKTILDIFLRAYAIKNQDGRIIGLVGLHTDITERKWAEDALLRANQKLNVLSQLTRNDLANQIFVLSSYLELTKKQLAGQDNIIETLQKGVSEIRFIQETIEYSKDYQDMGAKPPKWQSLKMAMVLGLSHISIGEIRHSLETENLEIFADPLLEKVCQRLFENSVEHGDHVTQIRIWHTITSGAATIFFEDDGIGISAEKKEQIFLRSDGPRASIRSLIFVREILDITGITIRETGEPGKGARFEMTVPKGAWRRTGEGE